MFPCREEKSRKRTKRKGLEATQGGEGGEEAQPADLQGFGARERTQAGHTVTIVWSLLPFCQSGGRETREGQRFSSRDPERGEPGISFASTAPRASPIAHHSEAIQSLSGWDGFFTGQPESDGLGEEVRTVAIPFRVGWGFSHIEYWLLVPRPMCRNPFQGGMGFFTVFKFPDEATVLPSQSLSGWDGVFHLACWLGEWASAHRSQSLSGWDGVFHLFSMSVSPTLWHSGRNPFQGGMGFFTSWI